MNTHRLDVSDFEHTRPRWVPLILTLIGAGLAGLYWIHSLYSA